MATLGEYIGEQIRHAIAEAIKDEKGDLTDIAAAAKSTGGSDPFADVGDILGILGILALAADPGTAPIAAIDAVAGKSGRSFGAGYLMGYALWQLAQPIVREAQHAAEAAVTSMTADPETAAKWEAAGITFPHGGLSDAAGYGWDNSYYSAFLAAARNYPSMNEMFSLMNRNAVTSEDVALGLERAGFPKPWVDVLPLLARTLLSPADLALGQLRGHLDSAYAQQYAQTLGVTSDDFATMVANTGEPPGLMQMIELWRRGYLPTSDPKPGAPSLEQGIRESRVRNEWVPFIEKLEFEPLSTADAVRAQVEGHITKDQAHAIGKQNGLAADDVDILIAAWGRPPSHEQMLQLLHRNIVTEDDVKQAILESDIKDKYVNDVIALGRRLVPERTIVSMLHHGVIDNPTAVTMLSELGFERPDADRLIALGLATAATVDKHLTRADILGMYADSLLPHATALADLIALGFTQTDAEDLLSVQDRKVLAGTIRTAQTSVKAALKAHNLTRVEAIAALVNAGTDHNRATVLVDQWIADRGLATRTLTEAQIVKLATERIITVDQCLIKLQAYGLSAEDATFLLELHGMIAYQQVPPPTP